MNKKLIILPLLVLAGGGWYLYVQRDDGSGLARAHGTVDIRQASLAFETSGRIVAMNADEGDMVRQGDILAVLDTQALDHQIAIQKAQCEAAEAKLLELNNGYQEEDIAMAQAEVDNLKNALEIAELTYARYQDLYKTRSISAQERDEAYYSREQTAARLKNAQNNLLKLTEGYRDEEIAAQTATVDGCNANLAYLNYQKDTQAVLRAPFDGQIRSRLQELGDMTATSSTVYELSLISDKRVRVYAGEAQLSFIRIGSPAAVILTDGTALEGTVARISNTAMFTPKAVQTEDLRADLVYEVRVDVGDPDGRLRLGQPVTVDFGHE